MLLGLLKQRDAKLVLGQDALIDEDLAKVALGLGRRRLVHGESVMLSGALTAFASTCSGSRALRSTRELRRPVLGHLQLEACAARLRQRDRPLVILQRERRLAQMIEADGEVVGEVGVVGLGGIRLEVLLLRFRPAALLGELVAEGEIEDVSAGILGE